jgi:hypothetical protein
LSEAFSRIECADAACAITLKSTLGLPAGTLRLAIAINAGLELEMAMERFPPGFDKATTQWLVLPTGILVGLQASDDKVGVGHSRTVVLCREVPRAALTTA